MSERRWRAVGPGGAAHTWRHSETLNTGESNHDYQRQSFTHWAPPLLRALLANRYGGLRLRHQPPHSVEECLPELLHRDSAQAAAFSQLSGGARHAAHDLAQDPVRRRDAGRAAQLARPGVTSLGERPQQCRLRERAKGGTIARVSDKQRLRRNGRERRL